jgi:hypothetical protein
MARAETTTRVVIRIGTAWLLRVATAVALERMPAPWPKGFSASSKKKNLANGEGGSLATAFSKTHPPSRSWRRFTELDCFSKLD